MDAQTTRVRRGERSRGGAILEAARELFFKNGYRGTTVQQIASQAGYSKRTVYLDYLSKDELFMTICVEGGELLLKTLSEIPLHEFSAEAGLERIMQAYVAFSREQSEYFRMIFSEATPAIIANCSEELRVQVEHLERACLGVVVVCAERAMREGSITEIDPWEAAGMLIGTATGIILLSTGGLQTVFSREALESLVERAVWSLWRGLRAQDESPEEDLERQEA
jgi:AcrR family transcriptional regulator